MDKFIKSIKKNTIFLLIITILVLFFLLKDNFISIYKNITNINVFWLFIALLCVLIYWICQSLCTHMIAKEYSENLKFETIFKQNLITQFFNGITPFSTGGQPMAIYMLKESGIKTTHSTNIILQNFILYQMALIFMGFIAVILNYSLNLFPQVDLLRKLIILGFGINSLVGIALLFISFSKKFNKEIIFKIIDILSKFKIIKNKKAKQEKWSKLLLEFHDSAELFRNNKKIFIKGFVYHFIGLLFFYIVPIFVVFSLKDYHSLNIINTLTSSAYVLIMGSFVPIPGGSGGIEYGYMAFFGTFLSESILSTSLLLWRFITYYLGILIGGIMLNFYKGGHENENRTIH